MERKRPRSKARNAWSWILAFIVLVISIRLVLPYVILKLVNKNLATMGGYYGHVNDVDLAIIRGAYQVDSIYLNKRDSVTNKQTPFFAARLIDLSVEWKSLFNGSIVGELVLKEPIIRFTKDKVEPKDVARDSSDLKELLDDFMPLQINRCQVDNGRIQYLDETSKPTVDISMTEVNVLAQNLRNSYDSTVVLPATIEADANVYEGKLNFDARANPLADSPTFDMSAELKNTNLVKLNDFFKAYGKVDVNKGSFGLYTEVAAKDRQFTGYVKPIINDLDVLGHEDRKDAIFQKIWEGLVGTVGEVFQNQRKDQLATKIPFKGRLDDPKTNIWLALTSILQNAFIHAIQPSIDHEISLNSIQPKKDEKKTLLQKVFSKDDEDKKIKKEKKQERKEARKQSKNN